MSRDEEEIAESGLKGYFYEYIVGLSDTTQFIIIENDPPPFDLGPRSMVTTFVGEDGEGGRPGLLPALAD